MKIKQHHKKKERKWLIGKECDHCHKLRNYEVTHHRTAEKRGKQLRVRPNCNLIGWESIKRECNCNAISLADTRFKIFLLAKYFPTTYLQLQESQIKEKWLTFTLVKNTAYGWGISVLKNHAIFFLVVDFFIGATVRVLLDWNSEDGPRPLRRVRGRPPLERAASEIFVGGFRRGFEEDEYAKELPEEGMGGSRSLGLRLLLCKAIDRTTGGDFVYPLLLRTGLFIGVTDFLGIPTVRPWSEELFTWSVKQPLLEFWGCYEQTKIKQHQHIKVKCAFDGVMLNSEEKTKYGIGNGVCLPYFRVTKIWYQTSW